MENLVIFWLCTWFIGLMAMFVITMSDEVFNDSEILTDKREYFRCVFAFQYLIYDDLSELIKPLGIIILIVLTTFCFWHISVTTFIVLVIGLILKNICILFYRIFKK